MRVHWQPLLSLADTVLSTGHIGPDVVERQCDQCNAREQQHNSDKITFTLFIAAWYCGE
jgi:hypothetical protein